MDYKDSCTLFEIRGGESTAFIIRQVAEYFEFDWRIELYDNKLSDIKQLEGELVEIGVF